MVDSGCRAALIHIAMDFSNLSDHSRVEISRSALIHNLATIRQVAGKDVQVAAVVKASAYGHGYDEVVGILRDQNLTFFAVHSIDEAAKVSHNSGKTPILILGYVPEKHIETVVNNDWRMTVFNIETINALAEDCARLKRKAYIHLKLETGTNRQGILEAQVPVFIEAIKGCEWLELEGLSMHFANIEDTTDHSYARKQLGRFNAMVGQFDRAGLNVKLKHTASSAASLLFSETHFDLIRFGISLYGLWPSKQTYLSYLLTNKTNSLLRPVMTWKTIISQIKELKAGEYVGYGCSFRTTTDTRIAVIPIGYYDGYDRKLSNVGHVLIRGKRAPIRGRICMNIFMVDVTHIPEASLEDEVVLLGMQGDESINAEQLAEWIGTINYEVVSRANPLLPRVVVD